MGQPAGPDPVAKVVRLIQPEALAAGASVLESDGTGVMQKIVTDDGRELTLQDDGFVPELNDVCYRAYLCTKRGRHVQPFFLQEILMDVDTLPWKFETGKQRIVLLFQNGGFWRGGVKGFKKGTGHVGYKVVKV